MQMIVEEDAMSVGNQVVDTHRQFVTRQWLAIKTQGSGIASDSESRMKDLRRLGLVTLQTAVATAGITTEDFNRCAFAVRSDPRLRFLQQLPLAAAGGSAFGDAVERSVYGSSSATNTVRETAALISMFTRMLDSLIDEAPKIVAPECSLLLDLLGKKSWMEPVPLPTDEQLDVKHPAASLLYKLMRAFVTSVRESDYWVQDTSAAVREDFAAAIEAALRAEYDTIDCRMPERSRDYDPDMRRILAAKSQNIVWVMALAPSTFLGWPDQLDKTAYETCMKRLGDLFGWLDDVQDFVEDVEIGATNELLLDLYENAGKPAYTTPEELHDKVAGWLGNERTVQYLVAKGKALYTDTMHGFEELVADPVPMQQYATDVSLSWIQPIVESVAAL
jgi:hypothetical protein